MSDQSIDERLSAIAEEMAVLEKQRLDTLAEIGEKAIPELREKPELTELIVKANELTEKICELREREASLLEEKERAEKEERDRIAKLTCFSCRTVNPESARFCEKCGAQLGIPPREYCTACGTMNQPGMKFCGECGTKLGESAPQ